MPVGQGRQAPLPARDVKRPGLHTRQIPSAWKPPGEQHRLVLAIVSLLAHAELEDEDEDEEERERGWHSMLAPHQPHASTVSATQDAQSACFAQGGMQSACVYVCVCVCVYVCVCVCVCDSI